MVETMQEEKQASTSPLSIGSIVHYYGSEDTANPRAAIITRVPDAADPDTVNLTVFNWDGTTQPRTGVAERNGEGTPPEWWQVPARV